MKQDLKQEEFEVIYRLLKENAPKSEDKYYNDYYGRYEKPINKKLIVQF